MLKVRNAVLAAAAATSIGFAAFNYAQAPKAPATQAARPAYATAIFAGGCFWSIEKFFDQFEGVISTTSGFTGGNKKNPTYEEVSAGRTGHLEAVKVEYDPKKISYEKLVDAFWFDIDPTTKDRAFCDTGDEYNSAIFYLNDEQKRAAEMSKARIDKIKPFKEAIVTPIRNASEFYPAEEYHQDFYKKNPLRYQSYRIGCGRDARLKQLWGTAAAK